MVRSYETPIKQVEIYLRIMQCNQNFVTDEEMQLIEEEVSVNIGIHYVRQLQSLTS